MVTKRHLQISAAFLFVAIVGLLVFLREKLPFNSSQAIALLARWRQSSTTGPMPGAGAKAQYLPLNDSFEFPFLGRVRAHSKIANVSISTADGKTVAVPFKLYYGENGQFLRAEFNKPGAKDYSFDADHNRRRYMQSDETVNGLPKESARVPFEKVLGVLASEEHSFGINFNTATKIDVTYVTYTRSGDKPAPVYIINVFGCHSIAPEYSQASDEGAKRIRYVVDGEGKTWFFDNNL